MLIKGYTNWALIGSFSNASRSPAIRDLKGSFIYLTWILNFDKGTDKWVPLSGWKDLSNSTHR